MEKIEWRTPQYIHTEKTSDWYWIVGIITVTIVLISVVLNNVIFAVLVLISSFTLSLYASHRPELIENEINESGIKKGNLYFPYSEIESFWVESGDRYPRILFKQKHKLSQFLTVLIHTEDAEDIKSYLSQHLAEEKMTESIFEKLLIYFGF